MNDQGSLSRLNPIIQFGFDHRTGFFNVCFIYPDLSWRSLGESRMVVRGL
jgi:hypothetical protein